MRGGLFKSFRLALIACYAVATLVAAVLAQAHHAHDAQADGVSAAAPSVALCRGGDGTKDRSGTAAACCAACPLGETGFVAPTAPASFSLRREITTRLAFARRLGHVADATPDNLRSRAPPAAVA
jgi:hypothetical protein